MSLRRNTTISVMAEHVEASGADFLLALALAFEAANETFGPPTTRQPERSPERSAAVCSDRPLQF